MTLVPIWIERQVVATTTVSARARHRIAELVRDQSIRLEDSYYWGQWLDSSRDYKQKGIYGTAAAIEILARSGDGVDRQPLASALAGLPLHGSGTAYDPDDTELVFKVIAIIDACASASVALDIKHPAVDRLINMRVDERGWCGYSADTSKEQSPDVTVTANALRALAQVPAWRVDVGCRAAVLWLARMLRAGSTDSNGDAVGLLALNLYRDVCGDDVDWRQGQRAAEGRVEELVSKGAANESRAFHYEIDLGAPQDKYMYFSPAIVGALALLSGDPNRRVAAGSSVTQLVLTAARSTVSDGGLRVQGRVATVDQLWLDRLLTRFEEVAGTKPSLLLPRAADVVLAHRRRWVVVPVLLLLAWVGVAAAAEQALTWVQVVGAVGSGLALNVLATVLTTKRT